MVELDEILCVINYVDMLFNISDTMTKVFERVKKLPDPSQLETQC